MGYINYRSSSVTERLLTRALLETQKSSALKIKTAIDCDVSALKSLAASISGTDELSDEQMLRVYKTAVGSFLDNNRNFASLSISWELGVVNPAWDKSYGRRV